jgi:hypothetical protein
VKKVVIFHSEKVEFQFDADGNTISVRSRVEYTNSDSNTSVVDVKPWPANAEDTELFTYFLEMRRKFHADLKKYAVED